MSPSSANRWQRAVGAGLPVQEARGSMVLDIGGGTSEVAVLSLNGIVYANSARIGGDRFDDAVMNYVRRNYGILIGEATAERIKIEIGSAYPGQQVRELSVKGRNLSEGVPRSFTLNSNEILEALQEPLQGIVSAVKQALEQTPPELGADVAERGIVLTGGGALLRDIDKLLMEETGIAGRRRRRSADLRGTRRRPHPRTHGSDGAGTFRLGITALHPGATPGIAQAPRVLMAVFGTEVDRPLYGRGPSAGLRFTIYAMLSIALMYYDSHAHWCSAFTLRSMPPPIPCRSP